jgi:DNA polymerase elongation subunit (family B)
MMASNDSHATLFVYQHSIRDEIGHCKVRLFCLKPDGTTAVVKVTDFKPYFYIEVPASITSFTRRKDTLIRYLRSGTYQLSTDANPVTQSTRIAAITEDQLQIKLADAHKLPANQNYKGMMLKLFSQGNTITEFKKIINYDHNTNTVTVGFAFNKKKFNTTDFYTISAPFNKKIDYQQNEPKCTFLPRKHLYFAHKRFDGEKYVDTKTEFLKVEFNTLEAMKDCYNYMNQDHLIKMEGDQKKIYLKSHEYEPSITPLLKFFAVSGLPSVGWVDVLVPKNDVPEDTFGEYDIDEYKCSMKSVRPSSYDGFVSPKVFTFDIEAYSDVYNAMPNYRNPVHEIFQISVILSQHKVNDKHLFTIGQPHPIPDVTTHYFKSELELLRGFFQFIREERPNVILGYNSLGFDLRYILRRCVPAPKGPKYKNEPKQPVYNLSKEIFGLNYFTLNTTPCTETMESWSSSAFGNQTFTLLEIDGVVLIDLFPIISREFKLVSYKLDSVAEYFLGANKDPVTPKELFKTFESKHPASLARVGKYCVQDAMLTFSLFEKLQTWMGMCEMAKTTKVPLMFLFTKGQQVKIYSQLLDYAQKNDYVIESNVVNYEDITYKGATVYAPSPGMYNNVLAFDFASLYPSIIISHNIDYSTLVRDDDHSIPDEHCHIFEWSDHENCEHDPKRPENIRKADKVYCGNYRYRFLKHEIFGRGIIPTIIDDQLKARKNTRNELAKVKKRLEEEKLDDEDRKMLELKADVLEERQKSYKVNANSMYGVLGARKGYLPMLPAAMSVTYVGRQSIKKASQYIEQTHQGTILYGDTDSCFCTFPIQDLRVLHELAQQISEETRKLFPAPMKLEYEGKIYKDFFILSKKRYAARACDENGVMQGGMLKKGVQTKRRDSTKLLKVIYDKAIEHIMNGMTYKDMLSYLTDSFHKMFTLQYEDKYYTITKSLAKEDYASRPPQLVVAEKMKARGKQVPVGARIDYVVTTKGGWKASQAEKIEEDAYYRTYRSAFQLDYLFYMKKQLMIPIGEIVEKAYQKMPEYRTNWLDNMFETRVKYNEVVKELNRIFYPIEIEGEEKKEPPKKITKAKEVKATKVTKAEPTKKRITKKSQPVITSFLLPEVLEEE